MTKQQAWQEPIGEARLNRVRRNADLDAHNARLIAEVAKDTGGNLTEERAHRILSRLGDERQLRGIPAVGRECGSGAINRTRPGDSLNWT